MDARGEVLGDNGNFFMPVNPHFIRKRQAAGTEDRPSTNNKFPSASELALLLSRDAHNGEPSP